MAISALVAIYMSESAEKPVSATDSLAEYGESWNSPLIASMDEVIAVDTTELTHLDIARRMKEYAAKYLGTRYRFGATGPKSFDCSGFTSHIFKNFGLELNRTSRGQYTQGENVDIKDVRPGDLLFFSGRTPGKQVGHVAMVTSVDPATGKMEFIHASSSKGISYQTFPDNGYYSRRFIGARRILGTDDFPHIINDNT